MVNKVILIGNLGKDPEIKHFDNGGAVGKFSVATNENYMDKSGEWQKKTEWHDVVVWNKQAERAERSLQKGMMVYVEGKLTHRKWQDDQGNNRYTTEVVANTYRLLERRDKAEGFGSNLPGEENTPAIPTPPKSQGATSEEMIDDDLPF